MNWSLEIDLLERTSAEAEPLYMTVKYFSDLEHAKKAVKGALESEHLQVIEKNEEGIERVLSLNETKWQLDVPANWEEGSKLYARATEKGWRFFFYGET